MPSLLLHRYVCIIERPRMDALECLLLVGKQSANSARSRYADSDSELS
ncbi:hypothetical protein ACMV5I_23705 [Serratia sp. T13T92]